MTTLVFVDTETTSLRPDRRAWEVALIVRKPGVPDQEYIWLVRADDLDLGNADPFALRIGRFYERHPMTESEPEYATLDTPPMQKVCSSEAQVMRGVEELTRGAHLVGAVPNFDAEVLGARMRHHGLLPAWHYHLIDVETLAVGALATRGEDVRLPWNSEDLSRRLGVEPASDADRHTALGDARWARDLYDKVMLEVTAREFHQELVYGTGAPAVDEQATHGGAA